MPDGSRTGLGVWESEPCGRAFESSIKVGQTGVWPVDFCNADKLLGFGMVGLEIEVVGAASRLLRLQATWFVIFGGKGCRA